jgi:hypothetical protein
MVLPDLSIVQQSGPFGANGGVSGDAVYSFAHAIDHVHDRIIPMGLREFYNEVNTNHLPSLFWSFSRMEFSGGSTVLQIRSIA